MRSVTFATMLALLAGCANQATHLSADLASADLSCQQRPFRTETDRERCYDAKERPVIARDLPSVLHSYDAWRSARFAALKEMDKKVTLAQDRAFAILKVAQNENDKRLYAAVAPFWPKNQKEAAVLRERVNSAMVSSCTKDGLFLSASFVTAYTCERNVMMPIIESEVPAASKAYREFWDRTLGAAAIRDQAVLPVMKKAAHDFTHAVAPATAMYRSDLQAALQEDQATTEQQQQEIGSLLGLALAGFAAGYATSPAPVTTFTSCTRTGNVVNCVGQ